MRVTFVNRFYWPAEPATAQLLADLAEGLAAAGIAVSVVTGRTTADLPREASHRGVTIHRVGPVMAVTQNLARRAADFAAFHLAARRQLRRTLAPGDIVVALTDPPLLGVTVRRAALGRGARLVHWVHDIYPEILHAVARNPAAALARATLTPARDTAWRRADACVVLGEAMAATVRASGVDTARVHVIPNWAPRGVAPAPAEAIGELRRAWQLGDRFVVGYSGNLGRVHDIDGLLDVAERLRGPASPVFLFVGGGAAFARLERAARTRGLDDVRFLPPQPRERLAASLSVADVHVVSLREGCESLVFPSKLYGVAAVGRPVLALAAADSELAQLVTTRGLGAAFPPRATDAIAAWLQTLGADPARRAEFGAAARRFAQAHGADSAIAAWRELLRKLDAPR